MTENTAAQKIEIHDTVRLIGRKGKGEVTGLKPGFVEICYTFNVRRYGQGRGCSLSFRWYAADRVELVRKGNAEDDAVKALFDELDTARARAAGLSLQDYRAAEQARQDAERAAAAAEAAEAARLREAAAAERAEREAAAALAAEHAEAEAAQAREVEAADLARWKAAEEAHRAHHGGDFLETLICGFGGTPACGFSAE